MSALPATVSLLDLPNITFELDYSPEHGWSGIFSAPENFAVQVHGQSADEVCDLAAQAALAQFGAHTVVLCHYNAAGWTQASLEEQHP